MTRVIYSVVRSRDCTRMTAHSFRNAKAFPLINLTSRSEFEETRLQCSKNSTDLVPKSGPGSQSSVTRPRVWKFSASDSILAFPAVSSFSNLDFTTAKTFQKYRQMNLAQGPCPSQQLVGPQQCSQKYAFFLGPVVASVTADDLRFLFCTF